MATRRAGFSGVNSAFNDDFGSTAAITEGAGGAVNVSTGGERSRFTAALADALLPALSVTVPEIAWLRPSVDTV